ncbi:MAG: DUF2892 domain-containing protein [Planctomycetaceae bacterium]|nr:DUF2892 domain-containing protein [Planctomycetaceae bacterium]
MIPSTTERVPQHTAQYINQRICETTESRILCSAAGGREAIDRRLAQLDREWDIERALEANAAAVLLLGVFLGATVNRKWFAFPAVVGGFLLQHAIQGWCPPVPILRRLGFRTQPEIERERYALKALRGDFRDVPPSEDRSAAQQAINAATR